MKYARIKNNVVIDVCDNPSIQFCPLIATRFVEVPDDVSRGWVKKDGVWSAPVGVSVLLKEKLFYPIISPLDFKMCLTVQERLGGKSIAETDEVLADFYEIIEDPRLKTVDFSLQSVRDAIGYLFDKLVEAGVVAEANRDGRVAQILAGKRL